MGANVRIFLIIALSLFIGGMAIAAPSNSISIPNSFSPNTTIQSSQANANNNEISSKYNAHTHTDITTLGTITSGTWQGGVIGTTYGGTGKDFSAYASGGIVYFTSAGALGSLNLGGAQTVLTMNSGATGFSWAASGAGSKDSIVRGFTASASTLKAQVSIYAGTLYHNATQVDVATTTIISLGTAADYSSGSVASLTGHCYIGVDTLGNVKFLGGLAPAYSDTSGNQSGVSLYANDGTKYWRVIGSVVNNGSNVVRDGYYQRGHRIIYDDVLGNTNLKTSAAGDTNFTTVDASGMVPKISTTASIADEPSSASLNVWLRPLGSASSGGNGIDCTQNATIISDTLLDSSQKYQYKTGSGTHNQYIRDYILDIR